MIYPLKGALQHYVWGGHDYLPTLLNVPKEPQQYYAEWWLGAHSSAPSMIEDNAQAIPLNQFLQAHPKALGQRSIAEFGEELPYLLKILDVKKPLSIQLHPTKAQAEIGFEKENAANVALNAPTRTYKDRNHKPEMMIALSDFYLLHGFKPQAAILQTLRAYPSLQPLADKLQAMDLHQFYAMVMQASQSELSAWLQPIIDKQKVAFEKDELGLDNPDYWLLYTMQAMEIPESKLDAGLMCFYLFNIVHLRQGEGIYQDAGIPHAYLRGQNIELMACSDNVIRGGLTPKYVDIHELLQIVDCREVVPQIIPPAPEDKKAFTYQTPAKDFALERLLLNADEANTYIAESAQILMLMQGEAKLQAEGKEIILKQGESAFIEAATSYQLQGLSQGYAAVAKLPE